MTQETKKQEGRAYIHILVMWGVMIVFVCGATLQVKDILARLEEISRNLGIATEATMTAARAAMKVNEKIEHRDKIPSK